MRESLENAGNVVDKAQVYTVIQNFKEGNLNFGGNVFNLKQDYIEGGGIYSKMMNGKFINYISELFNGASTVEGAKSNLDNSSTFHSDYTRAPDVNYIKVNRADVIEAISGKNNQENNENNNSSENCDEDCGGE